MLTILWHVWALGHSVRVNRCMTRALGDSSLGWLYHCECGETGTR